MKDNKLTELVNKKWPQLVQLRICKIFIDLDHN